MWRDSDDDLDDREFPDDEDDGEETDPCPHCGEPVYDDAERCPHCERYLSREDRPWSRPAWLMIGVAVCIAMVLYWNLR